MPLAQDLIRLEDYRSANPQLADLSDVDLADLVSRNTGELGDLAKSSALGRTIARGANVFNKLGEGTETFVRGLAGDSYASRVGGRAANMLVSSSPELAVNLLAARVLPQSTMGAVGLGALNFGLGYGRTAVETGDQTAALGSGGGAALSLVGALAGANKARYGTFKAPRDVMAGSALKGAAGAYVGSLPGTALEIGTQPGGFSEFLKDPVNLPAVMLAELPMSAIDVAREHGQKAKLEREKRIAETPSLEDLEKVSPEQEFVRLSKTPVSQLSEQGAQRMRELQQLLRTQIAKKTIPDAQVIPDFNKIAESDATIIEQVRMMNRGKKAAVMIPAGQKVPKMPFELQPTYDVLETPEGYFMYNRKMTNPQAINDAIKSNTLGELLGYGVPNLPQNPNGYAAVLRNAKGIEKMSVMVSPETETAVLQHLQKLADGGDFVRREALVDLVDARAKSAGLIKNYSLQKEPKMFVADKPVEQLYSDWWLDRTGAESAAEVRMPHWIQNIDKKTVLIDPPAEFVRYLHARKATLTETRKQQATMFALDATNFWQNSLLRKMNKAFERTEKKGAKLQLDAEGNVGTKGILRVIENSVPKEMFEHYKAAGLEKVLKGVTQQDVDAYNKLQKQLSDLGHDKIDTPEYQRLWSESEKIKNKFGGYVPTLSASDKVNFARLSEWIKENTPEIEIKKLEVAESPAVIERRAEIKHSLETLGFYVEEDMDGSVNVTYEKDGDVKFVEYDDQNIPENARKLYDELATISRAATYIDGSRGTDAATGRYGVEPIPVEEMDRPVDILVRVPTNSTFVVGSEKAPRPLYKGPHFGDSDVNVLASLRGYFKGDTFYVFEVQSDWGQARRRELVAEKEGLGSRNLTDEQVDALIEHHNRYGKVSKHPLLESYETLAVKAAIQHALENGATKVAFSDAKTAMMIERHDEYTPSTLPEGFRVTLEKAQEAVKGNSLFGGVRRDGDNLVETSASGNVVKVLGKFVDGALVDWHRDADFVRAVHEKFGSRKIEQEAGMRQHYDASLPAIASRLTNDKGTIVDLGKFINREPSKYFNGKDNITARVYDLTNIKPEVQDLFAIYGEQDQYNFLASLSKAESQIEQAIRDGEVMTDEQFLDRVISGENVDRLALLRYLQGLRGNPGEVSLFASPSIDGLFASGRSRGSEVAVNIAQKPRRAFAVAAHEFSHVSLEQLRYANPEAYADIVNFVNDQFTFESRKNVLDLLYDAAKIDKPDLDYLAGSRFAANDPKLREKVAYEFMAGLSEVLAHQVYTDAGITPTVARWFSWMPMGVQRWLSQLTRQFVRFFGPQTPSLRYMLSDAEQKNLVVAYNKLIRFSHANEAAQARAYKVLKGFDLFDPAKFVENIPSPVTPATRGFKGASDEVRHFALQWFKDLDLVNKANDAYVDNFLSPLYRTKLYPETLPFFRELHHFRNKIKTYEHGYLSYLGQNDAGTLTQEQALKAWDDYLTKLTSPYDSGRNTRLEKMSKVITRNQEIRESLLNPTEPGKKPVSSVRADQLVTREQMVKDFGLSDEDARMLSRIIELPRMVAEQTLRHMQATDATNLSKLFFLQNNKQDINAVKAKVAELTRISNDAGAASLERKMYESYVEKLKVDPAANGQVLAELERRIFGLKQTEQQLAGVMEQMIRQNFANDITFAQELGKDNFINRVTAVAKRLAEARAEQQFIMRDEGYAPMTRRGRFLVQIFKRDFDGTTLPGTTEKLMGFKTKQEANEYRVKNGLDDSNSKLLDKEQFAERAQLYTTRQLQAVRDKARQDLGELIQQLSKENTSPDILKAYSDLLNQFRPLDEEIKEVISAKGDKFKERRWMVPGFNELDFLPNIFEYTNYKTVVGQKAQTRAEAELQMLRPEVQKDPAMLNRMQRELDYTLSRSNEMETARKLVFYNYLGASVRHMFQNLMQVPMNGIPEMVQQGAGLRAYSHMFEAANLAARYMKDGTTGNKTFDILLKQAEKDGVTIPNAIEFFAPDSSALENALDSISGQTSGRFNLGEKASFTGTQLWRGIEKFMRSTAVATEQVNRRTSFIMSLLEQQRKGVKDPRVMFNEASKFTDYVNFVGDKSNRPGFQVKLGKTWAHGPMLLLTAMQSFVFNHISQLYAYGRLAMRGDVNSQKAFATGTFHLLAMAGALGLPFASNMEQLFESVTGISLKTAIRRGLVLGANELFDIEEKNGGRIADMVLNGFPKLVGVEASQSIGLGDPLFRIEAGKVPTAFDMVGPVGGIAEKLVRGADALTANPWDAETWFEATRVVAPQAMNYWLRMADAVMKGGYYDAGSAPVVENLEGSSGVALAMGFTPSEVQRVRDVQTMRRKIEQRTTDDYRAAVDRIAQSLLKFEVEGDQNALLEANQVFGDYITDMAGTQDRAVMTRSIAQRLQQLKGAGFDAPTPKTERPLQEVLEAYPGTKYPYSEQLPAALDELRVAQSLGQPDVLASRLRGLQSSLLKKALYDSLLRAGYSPSQASALSSPQEQLGRSARAFPLLNPAQQAP